jgi:hypothetical protein
LTKLSTAARSSFFTAGEVACSTPSDVRLASVMILIVSIGRLETADASRSVARG